MTTKNNPNVFPIDFDPVEEIIDHVNQLALWSDSPSVVTTLEHALDEYEALEIGMTIDDLARIMHSFFGAPLHAAVDHESLTPGELAILYPGVTTQLLTWYVTLAE